MPPRARVTLLPGEGLAERIAVLDHQGVLGPGAAPPLGHPRFDDDVGQGGRVIGMTSFGQSAPAGELFEHFGFSVDNVVAVALDVLAGNQ